MHSYKQCFDFFFLGEPITTRRCDHHPKKGGWEAEKKENSQLSKENKNNWAENNCAGKLKMWKNARFSRRSENQDQGPLPPSPPGKDSQSWGWWWWACQVANSPPKVFVFVCRHTFNTGAFSKPPSKGGDVDYSVRETGGGRLRYTKWLDSLLQFSVFFSVGE